MDISHALEVNLHEKARQEADVELRRRTAFLEALVESSIDSVLVIDSNGKKMLQNQRMIDMLSIPPSEVDDIDHQLEWIAPLIKNRSEFMERIQYMMSHPEEVSRDEVELEDGRILDRYSSPVGDNANHNSASRRRWRPSAS
jgi:PAS domain-containing protein